MGEPLRRDRQPAGEPADAQCDGEHSGTGSEDSRTEGSHDAGVIGRSPAAVERCESRFSRAPRAPNMGCMTELELSTPPYLAAAYTNDGKHVFHSWSAKGLIQPTVIAGARGSVMWDDKGNRWLDFASQLVNVNIGHQHPKLVAAIQEQAGRLCTIAPSFANDMRSEAARLICELAPGDLDMGFFTNGGPEAGENAGRLARAHPGRLKGLDGDRSYHGPTGPSIGLPGG